MHTVSYPIMGRTSIFLSLCFISTVTQQSLTSTMLLKPYWASSECFSTKGLQSKFLSSKQRKNIYKFMFKSTLYTWMSLFIFKFILFQAIETTDRVLEKVLSLVALEISNSGLTSRVILPGLMLMMSYFPSRSLSVDIFLSGTMIALECSAIYTFICLILLAKLSNSLLYSKRDSALTRLTISSSVKMTSMLCLWCSSSQEPKFLFSKIFCALLNWKVDWT